MYAVMTAPSIRKQLRFFVTTTHRARDYQEDLSRGIRTAWAAGNRNVVAVLPTGGGKSFVAAREVSDFQGMSCVIAHRAELVTQLSVALAREAVRHRVVGPTTLQRAITAVHMEEFNRSFVDPGARTAVASVDSLVGLDPKTPWLSQIGLWVQDECHHVLADNKWGRACELFPNAYGLGITATPTRADGKGLGRHADGVMDAMVVGPTMRELIERGFLTDYRVFAPPSDIDLSAVTTTDSGDFSPPKLREARRRSHITGDVVKHYLRIAPGKLGVTFEVDIDSATETAAAYRAAGVTAEVVSSKTPEALRRQVLRRFRSREVLQLVNVDLFGEGFDLPAIEVVSMARPTQSYSLYCLDPETEVLTPDGWRSAADAMKADEVIAFDTADGTCRRTQVTGRVMRARYANERMFGVVSPHLDVCVSDNHTMLVRSKGAPSWVRESAFATSSRRALFQVPVAARGAYAGSGLSADELRFLGWFLSDGNRSASTKAITISQSCAKTLHVTSIVDTLRGCGFKFGVGVAARTGAFKSHAPALLFTVSYGEPRGRDKHLRGYEAIEAWCDKSIPPCYDLLTRDELLTLLDTLNLGDGWNQHEKVDWTPRTLRIACGTNRRMADRLQALCVTRGLRCHLTTDSRPNGVQWHTLRIKDTEYTTVAGKGVRDGSVGDRNPYSRSRFVERPERPEWVWCLTNDLGTLITRRNGRVAIVGNCQQFGRALRPLEGKTHAIIIDHVRNVERHRLPDARREWTLDRRERRARSAPDDAIPLRTCLNEECLQVYERVLPSCPFCGHTPVPADRSAPEFVDGDLLELDPSVLAALRGEADRLRGEPVYPSSAGIEVRHAIFKRHSERRVSQSELERGIALWAGWQAHLGRGLNETYRRFYHRFGTDIATAMTLGTREAYALNERIAADLQQHNVQELPNANPVA